MTGFEGVALGIIAALYVAAALLLVVGRKSEQAGRLAVWLAVAGWLGHVGLLGERWHAIGQIPIVTRFEDLTVDSLAMAGIYLAVQWRVPLLRPAGRLVLPIAAVGLVWALYYSRGAIPFNPSLRTNWLIIHAQLNSFAIGTATLAAAAGLMVLADRQAAAELKIIASRLTAWAFVLWSAMVAAGAYWASLAWGRYWGWDPIESWSFATAAAYAFVLHIRLKPNWRERRWAAVSLGAYAVMLFTTYGLLMIMRSIHGQYLFQ